MSHTAPGFSARALRSQRAASVQRPAPRCARPIPGFTSISGAIDFSIRLLAPTPFEASRRVIDVSANGHNNDGRPAAEARDSAVAAGITVNGRPILDAARDLDTYFARHVIGGPRAFMIVAPDMSSFSEAILRKLVIEAARRPASFATSVQG